MRALQELLALLAPPTCLACRRPLGAAGSLLCPGCTRGLPWLRGPGCPRCGLPRHRRDRGCPAAGAAFALAWAPLAYDGVARDLVGALKFRGALPVARLMGAQLAAGLPPALRGVDAACRSRRTAAGAGGAASTRPASSRGRSRSGSSCRS